MTAGNCESYDFLPPLLTRHQSGIRLNGEAAHNHDYNDDDNDDDNDDNSSSSNGCTNENL